jgi:hypothetical protein
MKHNHYDWQLILLLTRYGKVTTLAFDPAVNNFRIVSLNYFEKDMG